MSIRPYLAALCVLGAAIFGGHNVAPEGAGKDKEVAFREASLRGGQAGAGIVEEGAILLRQSGQQLDIQEQAADELSHLAFQIVAEPTGNPEDQLDDEDDDQAHHGEGQDEEDDGQNGGPDGHLQRQPPLYGGGALLLGDLVKRVPDQSDLDHQYDRTGPELGVAQADLPRRPANFGRGH